MSLDAHLQKKDLCPRCGLDEIERLCGSCAGAVAGGQQWVSKDPCVLGMVVLSTQEDSVAVLARGTVVCGALQPTWLRREGRDNSDGVADPVVLFLNVSCHASEGHGPQSCGVRRFSAGEGVQELSTGCGRSSRRATHVYLR